MGTRSTLPFFLVSVFAFSMATTLVAQESESVLQSSTDDLRALIDLEPSTSEIKKATSPTSKAKSKPAPAKKPTTQEGQIRSVLKQSRVVSDDQVKPATFNDESNTESSKQLKSELEQINKPAPLPAPQASSRINSSPDKLAAPMNTSVDDALFNFGVLVNDAQGGPIVRGVIVGSPAARAGITAGDRIKSFGSQPIANAQQLGTSLRQSNGLPTSVRLERRGKTRTFRVNPAGSATAAPIANATTSYRSAPSNGWRSARAQVNQTPIPAQPIPAPRPSLVPSPAPQLTPSQTGLSAQTAPPARRVLDQLAALINLPSPTDDAQQPITRPQNADTDVPPPAPRPTAGGRPQVQQRQTTIRQQVLRYPPQRGGQPNTSQQGLIFRGQGGGAVQPQRRRPMIGDGGRVIGNGRVINSVRRIFGR